MGFDLETNSYALKNDIINICVSFEKKYDIRKRSIEQ